MIIAQWRNSANKTFDITTGDYRSVFNDGEYFTKECCDCEGHDANHPPCGRTYMQVAYSANGTWLTISHFDGGDFVSYPENITSVSIVNCHLTSFPVSILRMSSVRKINVAWNEIDALPEQIVRLSSLETLLLYRNAIREIPWCVGRLPKLKEIDIRHNGCNWIPSTLFTIEGDLRANLRIRNNKMLHGCDTLVEVDAMESLADIRAFRYEFAEACVGLQDLGLPALVTLEILDALCPNAVRMAAKWDFIVAVKHFTLCDVNHA
jgi:hypothetical protein